MLKKYLKPIPKLLIGFVVAWLILVGLPSIRAVRGLLTLPLYRHDADTTGDAAYIMAGSEPLFERMRAASDLYHMHQVRSIYYLNEPQSNGYNFAGQRSETAGERTRSYLKWLGVPDEALHGVEGGTVDGWMSSRDEAIWFSQAVADDVKRVVVVTSAPHTRRSLLCFQRKLPSHISVVSCASSSPVNGAELYAPIWIEYMKLGVYWFFA